jgi:hypothetical protein
MIKLEILHPLLSNIAHEKEGIGSYALSQKMHMREQSVYYHLKSAEADGFIKKQGHKYFLTKDVFIQNGFGIIYDKNSRQFAFIGCQHYGDCICTGVINENCKLLKELKDLPIVKKFLKAKGIKAEK